MVKNKIHSIHGEMMHQTGESASSKPGSLKRMLPFVLRIAVTLIVLIGLSALYEYLSASPEKLFEETFQPFSLIESRTTSNNALVSAYKTGNSAAVVEAFNELKSPLAEDYFLVGNVFLNNREADKAIESFLAVTQTNKTHMTHSFEKDAEYYLGLSYLANNEPVKAVPIFEKIRSDPGHPYHSRITVWFMGKLKQAV